MTVSYTETTPHRIHGPLLRLLPEPGTGDLNNEV
jgi:hypothetical protein